MAGIYIHIPFCKKACFYCDFHFSVSLALQDELVAAIIHEIEIRRDFVHGEVIESIYFGGGTPSVLRINQVKAILEAVYQNFKVVDHTEITFECNPDDLSIAFLEELYTCGINRLSIGIQSFDDDHLKWMNRSHTNNQSRQCIADASQVGFKDITIDLIYGIPQMDTATWRKTVEKALQLPVNHLSAYSLTMEENTPYHKLVAQKKYQKPNDDLASEHYAILEECTQAAGWEHYEVSNFCKTGNYSRHNTSYWQNKVYLGVGPSAHSFDKKARYWNVSNNKQYLEKIRAKEDTYEKEILTPADQLNEYLLTGLRTKWGVDLDTLKNDYGYDILASFAEELQQWSNQGWINRTGDSLSLTPEGLLFADYIASELFIA